jgi:hypothetical protein
MTSRAKAFDRKALLRELRREEKSKLRERLRGLRARIREARALYRTKLAEARAFVKRERPAARQRARELRWRLHAELDERMRAEKAEARRVLAAAYDEARAIRDQIERDRAELRAEVTFQRSMKRIESGHRARKSELQRKGHAHDKLRESDEHVAGNIAPELRPLWERVKGSIRASRHLSRTEAFLAYAHEHPDEHLHAVQDESEQRLAELLAERQTTDEALASRHHEPEHRKPNGKPNGGEDDDVPF